MTLLVRRAEEADRPALFRLFASVFGAAPGPGEWEWKYDRNPSRGASIAAFLDSEAVGFFGAFATRYVGDGKELPGTSGVDVMTSPEARKLGRHGAYRELGARFVEENRALGIPFYFGFPNDRHRLVGERVLGFLTVERAGQWSRPALAAPRSRLRQWLKPIREVERFSGPHRPLAEALRARPGLRTDRSAPLLNWRFVERPRVTYRLLEASGPGRSSRGYAVVRLVGERALVVDLQALDESSGTVPDLLEAAAALAAAEGARTLEVRASRRGTLAARAAELGLSELPSDCCLELIPVDPDYPLGPALASFDYRYGDHDVF